MLALLLSCVSLADAQSTATTTALSTAMQACQGPLLAMYQNDLACAQLTANMAQAFAGQATDSTSLTPFCTSVCFPKLKLAYGSIAVCVNNYKPLLIKSLQADGVLNASYTAELLLAGYTATPQMFDVMCTTNEKGQFCMPQYSHLGQDIAANNGTANLTIICDLYFNLGCCLTTLDTLYDSMQTGLSIVTALSGICPNMVNFKPPPCIKLGGRATVLTVQVPINGLNCAAYNALDPGIRGQFETQVKLALGAAGLPVSDTSIKSVAQSGSACVMTVIVRADTDANTIALTSQAKAINGANLAAAYQILAGQAGVTSGGSLTLGSPAVTQTTMSAYGQQTGSAASLNPSYLIPAFAALLFWFA